MKTNTNLLKAKRVEHGYTQEDMSKFLKLSSISYGMKERGEYDFSQSEIDTIIKTLNLSSREANDIFFENKFTDMLNIASNVG